MQVWQTGAFEEGARRAVKIMKAQVLALQTKVEQLSIEVERSREAERKIRKKEADSTLALQNMTSDGPKVDQKAMDELRTEYDLKLKTEHAKVEQLQQQLVEASEQQKKASERALSQAKGADEKRHAQEINDLNNKLSTHIETIKKQETELKSLGASEADVKTKLSKAEKDVSRLELQLTNAHNEIEEVRSSQAKFEAELKTKLMTESNKAIASAREKAKEECAKEMRDLKRTQEAIEKRYLKEQRLRRKYYNELEDLKGKVRVFCRVRPLKQSELDRGDKKAVDIPDEFSIAVSYEQRGRDMKKTFEFDRVFNPNNTQEEVFEDTKRLCQSACDGYNVCIFAYGQTGAGKTWTMMGKNTPELLGVSPRATKELYAIFNRDKSKFSFTVKCSMYEIYKSQLVDLLNKESPKNRPKLAIKVDSDGSVFVENGIVSDVLTSAPELQAVLDSGMENRHTAATLMNSESSRSHLVQIIFVESLNLKSKVSMTGKLTLVDLAGSERAAKTGAKGDTMKEAQAINKSLSALGNVIAALTSGQAHVPYRDSVLTSLMKDCLGGNAKTLMFVNISPADYNAAESVSSMEFAQRCKKVQNKATASMETTKIKALKAQLRKLKGSGAKQKSLDGGPQATGGKKKKGKLSMRAPTARRL